MNILSLSDLELAAAEWRQDGAVVVLAAGCFDPLHIGHIQHLEAARTFGNVLVVAVASDRIVRTYKQAPTGPRRPFMPEAMRAAIVGGLRCVDATVINDAACEVIRHLRPHVYVKGEEYRDNLTPDLERELALLDHLGGRLEFASGPQVHSSTALLTGAVLAGR